MTRREVHAEGKGRGPILGPGAQFALQFALMGVFFNVVADFAWAVRNSGGFFVWSWTLGGILQLSVVLSLTRIWATQFGWTQKRRPSSARMMPWFINYLTLVGYLAAMAETGFRLAGYLLPFAGFSSYTTLQRVVLAVACLVLQTVLSLMCIRKAMRGIAGAVVLQMIGISGLVLSLAVLGLRHSPVLLYTSAPTAPHEHLPPFLVMLLIPAATLTGFDATRHVEEATNTTRNTSHLGPVPAVVAAWFAGAALFVVALLALPNSNPTEGTPPAFLDLLKNQMGASVGVAYEGLLVLTLLCRGVVLQIVAARLFRMPFRNGHEPRGLVMRLATPGSPSQSKIICGAIAAVLCLTWPVLSGLATAWPALWALAYGITIFGMVLDESKGRWQQGQERQGRWKIVNYLMAICWSIFLVPLLLLTDADRAIPVFTVIVLVGGLMFVLLAKPRRAHT